MQEENGLSDIIGVVDVAGCHCQITVEALFRFLVIPCGIFGEESRSGTDFSASTSVFPSQYHFTSLPY
jgi:hypothetical protein